MGCVFAIGSCINCGKIFSFNPNWVPSVRINNIREPICEACIITANPKRKAKGLDSVEVHPEAYEPCDENEL